jgi:hypothetical protein
METTTDGIVLAMRQPPLREWHQIIRKLHRIGCAEHARRLKESLLSLQKRPTNQ